MKNILATIFFFSALVSKVNAQINLVPNSSFEDTTGCDANYLPNGWFNPTNSTPDYITPYQPIGCGSFIIDQTPKTGLCYCGLFCYELNGQRDYIESLLSNPLVQNKNYKCSFWVSLADFSKFAVDKIGAYFSTSSITSTTSLNLNAVPQVCNAGANILTDTISWVKIEGSFIAQGGEQYITIGTFATNNQLAVDSVGGWFDAAYYYIDDVEVTEDSALYIQSATSENNLFVYPTLIHQNKKINVVSNSKIEAKQIDVLNLTGEHVGVNITNKNSTHLLIELADKAEGTYFLKILLNDKVVVKKIIIL